MLVVVVAVAVAIVTVLMVLVAVIFKPYSTLLNFVTYTQMLRRFLNTYVNL
jgi:hypothetical protein